jgi:hypothetical protein
MRIRNVLRLIVIVICLGMLADDVHAHWIQTHEEMTKSAITTLAKDNHTAYWNLLNKADAGQRETNLGFLLQGVRDADLRVNGIYAIDKHCLDYTLSPDNCPNSKIIYNDISDWPVGDHKYDYQSGLGGYSRMVDSEIERIKAHINDIHTQRLLSVLKENSNGDKLWTLASIMSKSNAADMADFFYARAQNEWRIGHPKDAMYNLGFALHLVQDLTVPHHANIQLTSGETEFEKNIADHFATYAQRVELKGDYSKKSAKDFVIANAQQCQSPGYNAVRCVEQGIDSSASLLWSFFQAIGYEGNGTPPVNLAVGNSNYPIVADNLSGRWEGTYFYQDGRDQVDFHAILAIMDGKIYGFMTEPKSFGSSAIPYLHSKIEGKVKNNRVTFTKTYDGAANVRHSVAYEGNFSGNENTIKGTWTLPDGSKGTFILKKGKSDNSQQNSNTSRSSNRRLTGTWSGVYYYPSQYPPVDFSSVIIFEGSIFYGIVKEPKTFGNYNIPYIYSEIEGSISQDNKISFTKKSKYYTHTLFYTGQIDMNTRRISGKWSIPGSWSGKFNMQ